MDAETFIKKFCASGGQLCIMPNEDEKICGLDPQAIGELQICPMKRRDAEINQALNHMQDGYR